MARTQRPEIGTMLWSVEEHRYYVPGKAAPLFEYCVCSSIITEYIVGGFVEMKSLGVGPDGYRRPFFFKLSGLGKFVFLTPEEAAKKALEMTEKYERVWGYMLDKPLRRPWESYL